MSAQSFTDQDLIPDRALRTNDKDAFEHEAIVENLASHVERGDGPLNIALYGPWGSGKSSAYKMLARRLEGRAVKPVRYDAWRFGGESLQRNFISHAANTLGFGAEKHRQYHDGLFEGRRHAEVDLTDLKAWTKPMVVFSIVLIVLLCIVTAIAVAVSFLTNKGPLTQIGIVISGFFIPAAVGSLVVAALKAVIDGATVTVEQSRPSSEDQFGQRFDELVTDARAKHKADRIVFFIDELDRCSPGDVVATLTAIKTFLDRDDCVFVVAADRQVLEAALKSHLAQATPANEDHPYYSSASAFLDKVFHHQMYLPPLRPVSLTRFARDLVKERGGVWEEIRILGEQKLLDDVVYALIPSHVVSPRRVKVLLNNFASNVRIAQGRKIYWEARVLEIAKLTVLQTEFPNLAHDLPDLPALPDLLLHDQGPENRSSTVLRLLKRHALGDPDDLEAPHEDALKPTAEAPDPLIALPEASPPAKHRAVHVTQKRDLRRYLERCEARGIPSPKRDLLYLGTLGPTYGLGDSRLAEQLETDAREVPAQIIAALGDRSRKEREAAAKILGDLSRHEFGPEQEHCITAMLGAADVPDLSAPTAARLVAALDEALGNGNLADSDLAGALTVALASNTDEGTALSGRIVATDALLDDLARVERVAAILNRLPRDSRPKVVAAVARAVPEHPSVLTRALRALPDGVARELLRDSDVESAVVELVRDEDAQDPSAEEIISEAYAALDGKPRAALALQWTLVEEQVAYDQVREHAEQVLGVADDNTIRTSHAIRGMQHCPPADWELWSSHLDATVAPPNGSDAAIAAVAKRVVEEGNTPAVAERIGPFVARLPEETVDEVIDVLRGRLSETDWWTDAAAAERQATVYRLAEALGARGTIIGSAVSDAIEADFNRIQETVVDPQQPDSPTMLTTSGGMLAVAAVAAMLPDGVAHSARDSAVHVVSKTIDPEVGEAAALAVVELSRAIADAGGPEEIPQDSTVASAVRHGQQGRSIVAAWLELRPRPGIVAVLASSQRHEVHAPVHDALADWARRVDAGTRTEAVLALLATGPQREDWVAEIARHGVDEARVIEEVRGLVADAGRAEQRREIAMLAASLRPADARTRRVVGRLIEDLLGKRTQIDHGTAMKLVPSLGRDHQSATAIKEAIDHAWNADHRLTVGPKDLAVLGAAGIEPKKRNWSDRAKKGENKLEKAARGIVGRLTGR